MPTNVEFFGSQYLPIKKQIFTFEAPKGIFAVGVSINKKMSPEVPGAVPDDLEGLVREAQKLASLAAARRARKTMSGWFDPQGNHYVGIGSKKTARGISVDQVPTGSPGSVMYVVKERRRSLRLIREGLPAGAMGPHSRRFLEWVSEKNISNLGVNRRTDEETKKSTMFRIANYVFQHGMSDRWSTLKITGGKRYFNYPQYYRANYANAEMESVIETLMIGGGRGGFKAAIDEVVMGVLSTGNFEKTGRHRVNVGAYARGSSGRWKDVWKNAEANFMGTEREAERANEESDEATWNYVQRVRSKMNRNKR